jgi:hypothetical protein
MNNNIIFARPRTWYDSYQDMYALIELSGYPLIYFDEIDPTSDNTYIHTVVNGENQDGYTAPRARMILFDIEWRLEGDYPRLPGFTEVWGADPWYVDQLRERGVNARFVPVGSHAGLNPEPDGRREKRYDYAMLMYFTYRRQCVRDRLLEGGVTISPNAWRNERHEILLSSRAMLNVHQHDNVRTVAPTRWALVAAYKLPMISETIDRELWYGMYYDYADLIEAGHNWRGRDNDLAAVGDCLYQQMCVDRTFRKCIEEAV